MKRVTGDVVAVHDGVRPFTSQEVIKSCFQALEKYEVVVPVIPIKESIRQVMNDKSFAVKRDEYRLIQTPQCFRSQVLKTLYEQPYNNLFTDDASLAEKMNIPVHLLPGNEENIKITTRLDMLIAETLIAKNK